MASIESVACYNRNVYDYALMRSYDRSFCKDGGNSLGRELRHFPIWLKLRQPHLVDSMRVWLCDRGSLVSNSVKVSINGRKWTTVATLRSTTKNVWQYLKFKRTEVVCFKIDADVLPYSDEIFSRELRFTGFEFPEKSSEL